MNDDQYNEAPRILHVESEAALDKPTEQDLSDIEWGLLLALGIFLFGFIAGALIGRFWL